ncbi:PLP-dependent aminotransferase family protein [Paenibacillus agilis]|uniref:PLP-dependent aminotransferase family protein n=1 Tax=Paenibacillus agilis TaxID=3020863 RepID=A0A559IC50_9BACL|nr:PLP-dependent aminotransferase family protein [Paenibacillus agilis]TVX85261.1 PLP-dependent aminotransferase family protein [Paenibacillus agilis]
MTWIGLDRSSGTPLYRQIYESYRTKILKGELQSGERIPSTRELSTQLQVSRNIIVEAYEQLFAEGYIVGRHGSGTFVAEGTYLETRHHNQMLSMLDPEPTIRLSSEQHDMVDFRPGIPALALFPRKIWMQLAQQECTHAPDEAWGYGKPEGLLKLRSILARYLLRTRGVVCHPEQLIITTGATQSISLITKLLLTPTSDVILEDPITHEIHTIFTQPGARLCPVPVDQQGMITHALPLHTRPGFVYVTPSHQYPLGGVLPIQRRVQLINFARTTDCYIVEDDYDSEFRYESAPISSLQGLDPDRVIYIGTFSKILSPALRIGYLILPQTLIERGRNLKWLTDLHTPTWEQMILARFIEEGHLERHIAKMKKIYRKRRNHLIDSLTEKFGEQVTVLGHSTGLHLIAEFADILFTTQLLERLEQCGVKVYPVEIHAIEKGKHLHRIILGYGNLSEEQIETGVQRLALILK